MQCLLWNAVFKFNIKHWISSVSYLESETLYTSSEQTFNRNTFSRWKVLCSCNDLSAAYQSTSLESVIKCYTSLSVFQHHGLCDVINTISTDCLSAQDHFLPIQCFTFHDIIAEVYRCLSLTSDYMISHTRRKFGKSANKYM